uniref:Uncharacterized protein n=1 Tax=Bursaphelenchus xylophilus TaxID=6326 RepID=A0A1I7S8B1_BURXY
MLADFQTEIATAPEPALGSGSGSEPGARAGAGNFGEPGFGAGSLFKFCTEPRAGAGAANLASAPALGAKSRSRSRNFDRGNLCFQACRSSVVLQAARKIEDFFGSPSTSCFAKSLE